MCSWNSCNLCCMVMQVALARLQNAEERLTLQGIRESTQSPVSVTSLTAKEDDRQEKVPS